MPRQLNEPDRKHPFPDMEFGEMMERLAQTDPSEMNEEITSSARKINRLATVRAKKEISIIQGSLDLGIEKERDVEGIGMGVLSDGTPYLNQRGLAALCGVQNAHIGTISSQWGDDH